MNPIRRLIRRMILRLPPRFASILRIELPDVEEVLVDFRGRTFETPQPPTYHRPDDLVEVDSARFLANGQVLAHEGAAAAASHADRVRPEWTEQAFRLFAVYCRLSPTFTTEDARTYAEARGIANPPDKRAWGAVTLRARREGLIEAGGYSRARDPKVHASPVRIWFSSYYLAASNPVDRRRAAAERSASLGAKMALH